MSVSPASLEVETTTEDAPVRDALLATVQTLPRTERLVLAVSGGSDSMVLLHAMARWMPERVCTVATFDHATGQYAREAASLVAAEARKLRVPVIRERAMNPGRSELEWREARWAFLNRVAGAYKARVATAHSADDQLETIVQRMLRGTGVRGLAALLAPSPVVRPWLRLSRAQLDAYRVAHHVAFLPDPANLDRRHQRVRVRHDLLPAIAVVDPHFGRDMHALAERAAQWRMDAEQLVETLPWREQRVGVWQLDRRAVSQWNEAQLGVVWPTMMAKAGVRLTAEGTRALIRFTIGDSGAGELRLHDGSTVVRRGHLLQVRSPLVALQEQQARVAPAGEFRVGESFEWPGWRFRPLESAPSNSVPDGPEFAGFPAGGTLSVRRWEDGDRICTVGAPAGRRISRYLAECGVPRLDRRGWPVVTLEDEVVWVPGVCRGLAAPHRSGRSDLIWYRSERWFD
jgi:tRNA(Ile)-lysidine synthase